MWFNPLITFLLKTPILHGMVSNSMMLVTITGRKSGKTFSTPVSYVQNENILITLSQRKRKWWRNLRGGAPVELRLRGKQRQARGEALEKVPEIADMLKIFFRAARHMAKAFEISSDADGNFIRADLERTAETMIVVRFQLE